jgi:Putative lactococcus lactis phage r1t holin
MTDANAAAAPAPDPGDNSDAPLFTVEFVKRAAERAIKTGAQAMLIDLGQSQVFNVFQATWSNVIGAGLGGVVLSTLTSVISAPFGTKGTPSLVK